MNGRSTFFSSAREELIKLAASPAETEAYLNFLRQGGHREQARQSFKDYEGQRVRDEGAGFSGIGSTALPLVGGSEDSGPGFWDRAYRMFGGTEENIDPNAGFSRKGGPVYGSASAGPEEGAARVRDSAIAATAGLATGGLGGAGALATGALGLGGSLAGGATGDLHRQYLESRDAGTLNDWGNPSAGYNWNRAGMAGLGGTAGLAAGTAGLMGLARVPGAMGAMNPWLRGVALGLPAVAAGGYAAGRGAIAGGKDLVNKGLDAVQDVSNRLPQDARNLTQRSVESAGQAGVGALKGLQSTFNSATDPNTWKPEAPNALPWSRGQAYAANTTPLNQTANAVNPTATRNITTGSGYTQ